MNRTILCLLAVVAAITAGCTLAPKYAPPAAPVPGSWPTGPAYDGRPAAPETDTPAGMAWQDFYTDANLRQVLAAALDTNRDLRLAALNVELARALYRVRRDELYPTVYAAGGGSRVRASGDLTQPGQDRTTERYDVSLGVLAWELDFFGRIRNLRDEALERYLATEEGHRSARILLVASVADAYLALAADREGLALAQNTLQAQTSACELVQRQYDAGIATELDLRQAQIPVEGARGEVARYTQRVAQAGNALELLVGARLPEELVPAELGRVSRPLEISPGLSSEVLLRRPDVMAAENRLKAAYASIGAARAAFFPRIALTTTLGTASDELSGLFSTDADTWSFAPQATLPIFDARTWSAYRISQVQREIAVTEYEKAVQTAFREVADTLAVRGTVNEQVAAQEALVAAQADTLRLALLRFEKGIDGYLGVLVAQRSLFAAQQRLIGLRLEQYASQVRLYAVLGGGG